MILKVYSYKVDRSDWVFIDGIAEVTAGRAFLRESKTGKENLHNVGIFVGPKPPEESEKARGAQIVMDKVFLPRHLAGQILGEKKPFVEIRVVYLSMRDGTHQSVAYWEAYLLNDEGKTIERL